MSFASTAVRRITIAAAAAAVAGLTVASTAHPTTGSAAAGPAHQAGAPASGLTTAVRITAATIPACGAGTLGAWVAIDQGNGAAGSIYYPLQFTNLGRHSCYLRGFPGVSAVNRSGRQLGSPAAWNHTTTPRTVILAPGATAHTVLRYSDATVSTAPHCDPTSTTYELRIYPPNQHQATDAAFDLPACSHSGPVYLAVNAIIPGPGTING